MKKILLILLVGFVVLSVGGVFAGYHFLYRPAKAYVVSLAQLQEIPKLEAQVQDKSTFTPPVTGELTEDHVQRFAQTQEAVAGHLGDRIKQIEEKYKDFVRTPAGTREREVSLTEAMAMLKDLAALVVEAKRVQVEAINRQGFSLSEYEWTRSQVYAAAGIPVNAYFSRVIRDVAAGREPDLKALEAEISTVPEMNRTLVAPMAKDLAERAGLVFLGL
jgi:hypothetical protein